MTVRAEATIDLDAIAANLSALRRPGVAQMAVVKADAYGHGAAAVARVARAAGAEWLGVALPSEARALRAGGDEGPMLAWLFTPGDSDIIDCLRADVDLNVGALWAVQEVADAARAVGSRARVHLKVDTGLGRGGMPLAQWTHLLDAVLERRADLEVVGIWSHLASGEVPQAPETAQQLAAFDEALEVAYRRGIEPQVRHLANSGAALSLPSAHYDLVRLGIAMYGISPGPQIDMTGLHPAMRVQASLASVKRVPVGHGVSYGHTWRAPRETSLGLVPMGYADGIPRTAHGAEVAIDGRRFPVVGRIAMDQFVIDVGDEDLAAGDVVDVWGPGDRGEPTAEDWADWDSTIGYEVVTRLGPRVPRRYVGHARHPGAV